MKHYLDLAALAQHNASWSNAERAVRLPVGAPFGLSRLGVNYTRLPPGAISALRHYHSHQDEWLLVLAGQPTLISDQGEQLLAPGCCVGFAHGLPNAHQLHNRSQTEVILLEVSDRHPDDRASYPYDCAATISAALEG